MSFFSRIITWFLTVSLPVEIPCGCNTFFCTACKGRDWIYVCDQPVKVTWKERWNLFVGRATRFHVHNELGCETYAAIQRKDLGTFQEFKTTLAKIRNQKVDENIRFTL